MAICAGLLLLWAAPGFAADEATDNWPAWRGPLNNGVAPKGDPPVTWSESKNVKWKVKLPGQGTSSPVIWGDRIFFLTAIKTDKEGVGEGAPAAAGGQGFFHGGRKPTNVHQFDVVCLSRKTGATLWQRTAREVLPHEGHHPTHGFASYSPVTDGQHVWASFGSRGVHCYDVAGKHVWSKDLGLLESRVMFGEGSSPALAGKYLIVVNDHEGESFIYALDKATGDIAWKTARDEHTNWSTPAVTEVNGKPQIIVSASGAVRGYDLATGKVVWQCSGQTGNVIPVPVVGFGKVFCASGFRGAALQAIELGRTGDLTGSDAVGWEVKKATPYVPSPLLYGDKLYVHAGNKATLSCYQARTGKSFFEQQRPEGMKDVYASPVGAAGRVYLTGRDGKVQVIKLADQFEVLATNSLDDGFDASPAIVGKELFLKGKANLYCIAQP